MHAPADVMVESRAWIKSTKRCEWSLTEAEEKLRVMLVDDNPERGQWVSECLGREGFDPFVVMTDHIGLLREISEQVPDVIVIDMESPGRDLLESLAIVSNMNPTPVLMFSAEQDPDYISRAVEAGVTAYMVGNIEAAKVKPAIDVAMAQFRSFQQLKRELDETRSALGEHDLVTRAKKILIHEHRMTEGEAHAALRNEAMKRQLKMTEVARVLIERDQRQRPVRHEDPA